MAATVAKSRWGGMREDDNAIKVNDVVVAVGFWFHEKIFNASI